MFDAAAKFQGTSLNNQLLQGPDCISNLAGILTLFCQEDVVLIADIEQMLHQVQVPAEDCDTLRFWWWSGNLSDEPEEYQMQVHIIGATSSCCCDKLLRIMRTSMAVKLQKQSIIDNWPGKPSWPLTWLPCRKRMAFIWPSSGATREMFCLYFLPKKGPI